MKKTLIYQIFILALAGCIGSSNPENSTNNQEEEYLETENSTSNDTDEDQRVGKYSNRISELDDEENSNSNPEEENTCPRPDEYSNYCGRRKRTRRRRSF